MAGNALKHN